MFEVYIIKPCPYCSHVVKELVRLKIKNKVIIVKTLKEKEKLCKKHKMNTFPQVFYKIGNKKYQVGGCSQFVEFVELCKYINATQFDIKTIAHLTNTLTKKIT
tara:strand:+ start:5077 stop:5385 length:309 start_codon:yes stop_codon:yes gene_type:complete